MADPKKPQVETPVDPSPPPLPEEVTDTGKFRAAMAQVIDQRISQLEGNLPETIRRIVRDELAQMTKRSSQAYKYLMGLVDMDNKE
jgi:hypothetical protein